MLKLLELGVCIIALIGILALALWVPGENWSYLWRTRTKREMAIWTILMLIFVAFIVGGALLHLLWNQD